MYELFLALWHALPDIAVEVWDAILRRSSNDYIYVNEDGTARELTLEEKEYIGKRHEFHPADGARPYIKSRYKSHIEVHGKSFGCDGFLLRHRLPKAIVVQPASQK